MKELLKEVKRMQELAGLVTEEEHSSLQDITPSEDASIDVSDFARNVAKILVDRYGEHNYERFMKTLTAELNKK